MATPESGTDDIFNSEYWNQRYADGTTRWDMRSPSPPLQEYCAGISDKSLQILIPGAGSSHDAGKLYDEGFSGVFVVDWSENALKDFGAIYPSFPSDHLICSNFFEIEGNYDLILEQTFFCALPPALRPDYVRKMHSLLKPDGKLAGVWFNFPLTAEGPPFGGSEAEYRDLFKDHFQFEILEPCRNSIPPRAGSELFFVASAI